MFGFALFWVLVLVQVVSFSSLTFVLYLVHFRESVLFWGCWCWFDVVFVLGFCFCSWLLSITINMLYSAFTISQAVSNGAAAKYRCRVLLET